MKTKDIKTEKEIHNGRRAKLRELFAKSGLESFNDTQVLEYALGFCVPRQDTNPTAHRLINKFGSLAAVIDAHPDKLKEIIGVGEQSAYFISFLGELLHYYHINKAKDMKITSPNDAAAYFKDVMPTYTTEQFVMVCLGLSGNVLIRDNTTSNDISKVDINVRELVDIALRVKTTAVVIAHNHPTDDPTPSDTDTLLTRQIITVFDALGIKVLDHIIFAKNGESFSFAENHLIGALLHEYKIYKESPRL
jgi:DNA repair protein RadC